VSGEIDWSRVLHTAQRSLTVRYELLRECLLLFVYLTHTRLSPTASSAAEQKQSAESQSVLSYLESEGIPRVLALLKLYRYVFITLLSLLSVIRLSHSSLSISPSLCIQPFGVVVPRPTRSGAGPRHHLLLCRRAGGSTQPYCEGD
jgi:hypothetical protein